MEENQKSEAGQAISNQDDISFENAIFSDEGGIEHSVSLEDFIAFVPVASESQGHQEHRLLRLSTTTADIPRKTTFSLRNQPVHKPGPPRIVLRHDLPQFFLGTGPRQRSELSVIVSTKSGLCQAGDFFSGVVKEVLDTIGISESEYKVYHTDSEQWVFDFASSIISMRANQGISQSILLLSGDGGVIDILNGLYSKPQSPAYVILKIGLLVLGTGNALANSSGLNSGNTKGLHALLYGAPQNIPTFIAKFSPGSVLLIDEERQTQDLPADEDGNGILHGAVVASWALHATLVADSDTAELRKYGSARFSMAANELLEPSDGSAPHKWKGKITTWHRPSTGPIEERIWNRTEHTYILATLVSNLEASLTISPDSKSLDGQLRLIEFPPLPSENIKQIFGLAFGGGRHVEHEAVGYTPIEQLRIDFQEPDARWRRVCIDGKIVRVPEGGWVEISRELKVVADLIV